MLTIDLDKLNIVDGSKILDLGCGKGRHIHKLYYYSKCHVIGLDLSLEELKYTYQGFQQYPDINESSDRKFSLMAGTALQLPFKDNTFDHIICSEVLEHIYDYKNVINEIFKKSDVIYVLSSITTKNKHMIDKKLLNLMKQNSCLLILSRANVVNFKDLIKISKKRKIKVATDVFPEEPVKKDDPIRKSKNILFSAHRAGALESVFYEMGEIVFEDLKLINKGLPPKLCRKAELETVRKLRSKPVKIN